MRSDTHPDKLAAQERTFENIEIRSNTNAKRHNKFYISHLPPQLMADSYEALEITGAVILAVFLIIFTSILVFKYIVIV